MHISVQWCPPKCYVDRCMRFYENILNSLGRQRWECFLELNIYIHIYIYAHIYVYVYTCRHFYLFGVKIPYISFMKWCLGVNLMLEYFYCLIYYRKNATPRNCKSGIMEWIGNYNWQMCHDKGAGIMDKHRNSVLMSDLATSKRSALGFLWKEWC